MKIKILMREVDGQSIAFKVARYVLINDAMIAVKTSTSGNYDNNNYNIHKEDKPKTCRCRDGGGRVRV